MYLILALFFVSLVTLVGTFGRKLVLLRNGHVLPEEEISWKTPLLEEWRHLTVKNIKKHGYNGLVAAIRIYFRSVNFAKNKYQELKTRIENRKKTKSNGNGNGETSKFLKTISEYKEKIREIKHRVKEEENGK